MRRADALEDARNDALHSPLWAYPETPVVVRPVTGLGHIRAQKLSEKRHLLREFRWCRDSAMILALFAYDRTLLSDYMKPWPGRPQLPNRGHGQGAKYHRRRKLARLPRSSQK